jgi:hypothetical protein
MDNLTQETWTHYLYILHFVDGHYYTGVSKRKGDNPLCDGYWGSPSNRKKWSETMFEKKVISYLWCKSHAEAYQIESDWQVSTYSINDPYCLNKAFSPADWTFEGRVHSQESKNKISKALRERFERDEEYHNWLTEHVRNLGSSNHKRNPSVGTKVMSGPNKRQYMRRHWEKEVWDAVKEKWEGRTSYHWGKKSLAKAFGVSVKTIENMLELIQQGVDWDTATNWEAIS